MNTGFGAHGALANPPQESWNPLSRDMLRALEDAILAELIQKQGQLQPQPQCHQKSMNLRHQQKDQHQQQQSSLEQPSQQLLWAHQQHQPLPRGFEFAMLAPPPGLSVAWPHGMPTRLPPGLPTPPHLMAFEAAKLRSAPCETPETASTADTSEEPPSPMMTPLTCMSVAPSVPELMLEGDVPPPPMPTEACTADCPSLGSMGHHLGVCTPCDFINRGFCRSGAECMFCHLCGPAERKLRKLQRRKMVRAIAREQAAAPPKM